MLSAPGFVRSLMDYDARTITDEKIKNLKPYIDDPKFKPDVIEKVSFACRSICMWARAVNEFAKVYKIVEPKQKRLVNCKKRLFNLIYTIRLHISHSDMKTLKLN